MKVAYVQQYDARDVRNWSGTLYFLKQAIERHVGPVVDLSPGPVDLRPFLWARGALRVATGKRWSFDHDFVLARWYGRHFGARIAGVAPDLIFAPAASACLAFLETDTPIVYFSDGPWRVMQGYHSAFANLFERSARQGDTVERLALERSALALFSSRWASDSAVRDYGVDPDKVHNVFIGANLSDPPARREVLPRSLGDTLRLLMVGVKWEAKGGPIAFRALLKLLEMGYNAELTVVGCAPPPGVWHPRLRVVPFLNKQVPAQRKQFETIWRNADFFLLPTRFEAAGVVFCEAAAHAIPVLATRTGGVPSLVFEGRNGYTLPPEAHGEQYAARIAELAQDPQRYARLCETSRDEFEQRLNWDVWGAQVARLIENRIPQLRGRTRTGMELE